MAPLSNAPAGLSLRVGGGRLLRWLLPVCLVAAAVVAVAGLFRVVGQPAATPVSPALVSLRLGGATRPAESTPSRVAAAPATPIPTEPAEPIRRSEPVTQAVVVMNASGITGLAGRTAVVLRQRGVSVASIGNLSPARRPAAQTVFYAPGGRGQAQTLATLSGAFVVAPAPSWVQPGGRLILVITSAGNL